MNRSMGSQASAPPPRTDRADAPSSLHSQSAIRGITIAPKQLLGFVRLETGTAPTLLLLGCLIRALAAVDATGAPLPDTTSKWALAAAAAFAHDARREGSRRGPAEPRRAMPAACGHVPPPTRMGLEAGADYFSDTTSPLTCRSYRTHNGLKFHIFPEN
jgi:hypothetical protein